MTYLYLCDRDISKEFLINTNHTKKLCLLALYFDVISGKKKNEIVVKFIPLIQHE
jgi:hypothetical protein